jgi:ribonuclease HII
MPRTKFDLSLLPPAPDLHFETGLWSRGFQRVAGVDEAGRGALAGPVCASAVILPRDEGVAGELAGVRDSKEMLPEDRERWAVCIRRTALAWGVGFASNEEIDALGIVPATRLAIDRALAALAISPDHLLVDFLALPGVPLPQTSLVKGDARSLSIASASVLAKTARDELLRTLDVQYPGYGFAAHKGYGTRSHRRCLARLGPCAIHRRTFTYSPVEDE